MAKSDPFNRLFDTRPQVKEALRRFQEHHGNDWPDALISAHMGGPRRGDWCDDWYNCGNAAGGRRPGRMRRLFPGDDDTERGSVMSYLRVIRNNITANPEQTPDLRGVA